MTDNHTLSLDISCSVVYKDYVWKKIVKKIRGLWPELSDQENCSKNGGVTKYGA